MQLSTRNLLGIKDLTPDDISLILSTATQFKEVLQRPVKKVPSLRDVTIVNLFYENSTRTRFSFELAEKRLSADTINFTSSGSSVSKGETLFGIAQSYGMSVAELKKMNNLSADTIYIGQNLVVK